VIHTLLNLTRPLIIPDTETTGVHPEARIIELGFQVWDATGLIKEYRSLIDPEIPIPAPATAVHGITDELIASCQTCLLSRLECSCEHFHVTPKFAQIAQSLALGFSDCDFGGKNIRFDLVRLTYEFGLAKVPWSYYGASILDGERLEQITNPRTLSDLYRKYKGEELEGAHGALTDARASADVICGQLQMYESLPRDLRALHELQWPGWLTSDGSFKMINGVPTCMLKKYRDVPMHKVPGNYYDWILSASFPEDVRELVRNAKLGIYPTATPEQIAAADKRMV